MIGREMAFTVSGSNGNRSIADGIRWEMPTPVAALGRGVGLFRVTIYRAIKFLEVQPIIENGSLNGNGLWLTHQ